LYPDGGGFHLREALAARFGVERSQIVLGNGSNELIELLCHAFATRGKTRIVASRYAFAVYRLMAQLFGVEFVEVPDRDFSHDLDAMAREIDASTSLVFIANPNNPTGARIPNGALESFVRALPGNVIAVLDEAYYEFLEGPPPSLEWVRSGMNVVLLRTFSKIQGLAGTRLGYAIVTPEMGEILQRCRQPFNANAMAQAAALAAMDDFEHQEKTRALILAGRERLSAFFTRLGLRHVPSHANFIMVEVGQGDNVFRAMMKRGIIVRSMVSYGLPSWIRVSIGTPEQMEKFETDFVNVLETS
jgi:histidinol-phosphate aminotransferase